jgi:hypothetical protein
MMVDPSSETWVAEEFVGLGAMSSSGLDETSVSVSGSICVQPEPLKEGLR